MRRLILARSVRLLSVVRGVRNEHAAPAHGCMRRGLKKQQHGEADDGAAAAAWWVPHPRTGIYYPKGHDWVMEDVPEGASSFPRTYWLRKDSFEDVDKSDADGSACTNYDHPFLGEFEPDWLGNQSDSDSMIGSSIYDASLGSTLDRFRLARNDQLPGVVLQARARLQERLRGISPFGNSQTSLTSDMTRNEVAMNDEMRILNLGEDAESRVEWFESGSSRAETDGDVKYANRPPGLSSKAFSNLQLEVYRETVEGENVERTFFDCSICLERFVGGEELIQLSCRHKFHPDCLQPWVKICGECPYCRTTI